MPSRLQRSFDAFNRGDFDTAIEVGHPDVELIPPGGQSPLRGIAAFRAWMEPDAFVEQRIEPMDFRFKDDKVLIRQRTWGRGAGSGIEFEQELWTVWTLNDEVLVTRIEVFLAHEEAEALRAAGMPE